MSYSPLTPEKKSNQKYWLLGELWPNMGYFNDSWRNWAGAFWAATAILLVRDPWNPIWDESEWLEGQFGAPFASLGPSGRNDYFTPNFWAGRSAETVGRRCPRASPKVPPPPPLNSLLLTPKYITPFSSSVVELIQGKLGAGGFNFRDPRSGKWLILTWGGRAYLYNQRWWLNVICRCT